MIERDSLGLTPECRTMLENKLAYTNIEDMCKIYPEMEIALRNIYKELGGYEVKSVEFLTFVEFWELNNIGLIRDQDKQLFTRCISIWDGFNKSNRIKVLRDFKAKYNRGIYLNTILMDIIDPYWVERKNELDKANYKGPEYDKDDTSNNVPFFC